MTETGYKVSVKLCCFGESKCWGQNENEAHLHAGHSTVSTNDKTENVFLFFL